jgi:hypothetical protein
VSDKLYCPIPDLGCCDSCHEDEAYGFPLQQNDFLYCCCPTLLLLSEHDIDVDDEEAVRAFVASRTENVDSLREPQ